MSHKIKAIVALIILIILVIIGWLWYGMSSSQSVTTSLTSGTQNVAAAGLTTSPSDTSDAALQSDVTTVDSQMNGLNSDTANIDQSIK